MFVITFGQEKGPDSDTNLLENMMVRIAEIEVEPDYLDAYISILKEEAEASVRLEPGVICIYPMFEKENPTQIRLLEIYANKAAYESHLQTPHFKHYKESTLPMVKSLQLVDMEAIDKKTTANIFEKMNTQ
jgi:quinol monooxygenase YgiN